MANGLKASKVVFRVDSKGSVIATHFRAVSGLASDSARSFDHSNEMDVWDSIMSARWRITATCLPIEQRTVSLQGEHHESQDPHQPLPQHRHRGPRGCGQ
ncbi:MAG TPA: hypothetical protein DCQ80_10840, partial [Pseudomonas sp.]|nr:hypothetical protein [Pseudomonas sp.]